MNKHSILFFFLLTTVGLAAQDIQLPKEHKMNPMTLQEALEQRQTIRQMTEQELPEQTLSDLLWAAYGFNRPETHKRTAPSAVNMQEMDIYVFTTKGVYLYDAEDCVLKHVLTGDHRTTISQQSHFGIAPVSIVIVANYERMSRMNEESRNFYGPCDAGYVSQNIYLFCAAEHLATVACGGIDREAIGKLLNLQNAKPMLAHPVSAMPK